MRVVFDRRLRTPPTARLFTTLEPGPSSIVTTAGGARAARARCDALRSAACELADTDDGDHGAALRSWPGAA